MNASLTKDDGLATTGRNGLLNERDVWPHHVFKEGPRALTKLVRAEWFMFHVATRMAVYLFRWSAERLLPLTRATSRPEGPA